MLVPVGIEAEIDPVQKMRARRAAREALANGIETPKVGSVVC